MEPVVYIRCLKRDVALIKSLIPAAVEQYKNIIKSELDQTAEMQLSVDEDRPLEERVVPNLQDIKFEELTAEHERQIKIDRSVDTQKW